MNVFDWYILDSNNLPSIKGRLVYFEQLDIQIVKELLAIYKNVNVKNRLFCVNAAEAQTGFQQRVITFLLNRKSLGRR